MSNNLQKNKTFHASRFTLHDSSGYLLLFAVVISSIVLAIGLGIVNIVNKGLILASSGRLSQTAFYAADGGIECALYWDRTHVGFPITVFATSTFSVSPTSGVVCASEDVAGTWVLSGQTASAATTVFDLAFDNGTCSTVTVLKTESGVVTVINALGYSTCNTDSPRRIERAIRVRY
ncbi:MAG: hypothetical protein HYT27_01635 [Parcubacteria group bacterium]|nr:hypothetical protein [Parcubacteria group bacterium]